MSPLLGNVQSLRGSEFCIASILIDRPIVISRLLIHQPKRGKRSGIWRLYTRYSSVHIDFIDVDNLIHASESEMIYRQHSSTYSGKLVHGAISSTAKGCCSVPLVPTGYPSSGELFPHIKTSITVTGGKSYR